MSALLFVLLSHTNGYAVGGFGVITYDQLKSTVTDIVYNTNSDTDGDGIINSNDAFPLDASESVDTDNDGIGNNSDTDDDGDGMPDQWELYYGLDPLVDDASGDLDNDGINNLAEYYTNSSPTASNNTGENASGNIAPYQPMLTYPENESYDVPLVSDLRVRDFIDSDEGDIHTKTQWQISLNSDFSSLVLNRTSSSVLATAIAPGALLKPGTEYFWRVRFYDSAQNVSQWAVPFSFTTRYDYPADYNENGVPDNQEVDNSVDLNQDGRPDKYQDDISSIHNSATDTQMGISGYNNVEKIEFAMGVDPGAILDIDKNMNYNPFGLITYRFLLKDSSQCIAKIKIYFSDPIPSNMTMYVYDPFAGLENYAEYFTVSPDRESAVMEFKDGGYGDADGIINGVIVNSGSIVLSSRVGDAITKRDNAEIISIISNVDESKACFIQSVLYE